MPAPEAPVQVFEGLAPEAIGVQLALERDGIRCMVQDRFLARQPARGVVYVFAASDVDRAHRVINRHLKGASASDAVLAPSWTCGNCGEIIEGQFEACWQCGTSKR